MSIQQMEMAIHMAREDTEARKLIPEIIDDVEYMIHTPPVDKGLAETLCESLLLVLDKIRQEESGKPDSEVTEVVSDICHHLWFFVAGGHPKSQDYTAKILKRNINEIRRLLG